MSELSAVEAAHLQAFAKTLLDDHCYDEAAVGVLNGTLAHTTGGEQWWARYDGKPSTTGGLQLGVPCSETQRYWLPGRWVMKPMLKHCCNKGPGVARCPGGSIMQIGGGCDDGGVGCSTQRFDDSHTLMCANTMRHIQGDPTCLLYSFGIANNFAFEVT